MELNAVESIDLSELASVTGGAGLPPGLRPLGGFDPVRGLLQQQKNLQTGGSVLRPPNPPNIEGSLTGEFNRNLGTWPRFANPGSAGTPYIRNPLLSPNPSPFRNHF
jgi:hypothetical protein